jgi:hypothetical protein
MVQRLSIYAFSIAMCPMLPVPLLDFFLVPVIARRMFVEIVPHRRHARLFASKGDSFCLGCFVSVLLYPIVKFFKTIKFFLRLSSYVEEFQYWLYKGYILSRFLDSLPDGQSIAEEDWKPISELVDAALRSKTMGRDFFTKLRQFVGRVGLKDSLRLWFYFGSEDVPVELREKLTDTDSTAAETDVEDSSDIAHRNDGRSETVSPFLVQLIDHDKEAIELLLEEMLASLQDTAPQTEA